MKLVTKQATHIVIVFSAVLVLTGIVAILSANVEAFQPLGSVVIFVFMAGTVGGIANNYQRLQRIPLEAAEQDPVGRKLITFQIYLSPLIGGVFAIVLYVIFMSGFIQGDFFPAFQGEIEPFGGIAEFADATLPATNQDAAKALIWAFIAGFAEGLVPNFIDTVIKESVAGDELGDKEE